MNVLNYTTITYEQFKALLINGGPISGFEIDWIFPVDFEDINYSFREQLRISNCWFKLGISIVNLKATKEFFNLVFDNCIFDYSYGLSITNTELTEIRISDCKSTHISISDCKLNTINVENTTCSKGFSLSRSECLRLNLNHNSEDEFSLIWLDSPKLELAHVQGFSGIKRIHIKSVQEVWLRGRISELYMEAGFERLEVLDIWDASKNKFVRSSLKELKSSLGTFKGDILVRDVNIKHLDFVELNVPNNRIEFKEVSIQNTRMVDCSILNMNWNQLEFINPPQLTGTDFSGLKMYNVQWSKNKELVNEFLKERILPLYQYTKFFLAHEDQYDREDISELKYDIETYRQLKAASIANHNQIEALAFYRNEMKLYWKLIRIEGGIPWYDRLLVFVNRWSSDFGQNWSLPLLWMFLFALLFYSCLLGWNYFGNDWTGGQEFGQFWVLFNPVHKTPEYINTGAGLFTEFAMRVVTGYFIYHFIRASRKFTRI